MHCLQITGKSASLDTSATPLGLSVLLCGGADCRGYNVDCAFDVASLRGKTDEPRVPRVQQNPGREHHLEGFDHGCVQHGVGIGEVIGSGTPRTRSAIGSGRP